MIGSILGNSIEDSLEDIDRETSELLESGKIELSQICSLQEVDYQLSIYFIKLDLESGGIFFLYRSGKDHYYF